MLFRSPNILITSPSINTKDNVSGIANLTRLLVENNSEVNYKLFTAGKKDNETRGIKWFFKQFGVLLAFRKQFSKEEISFAHINMPLEKAAILRDTSFAFMCRLVKKPYVLHLHGGTYSQNKQWIFEEGNFNQNKSYNLRLEHAIKLIDK